MSFSGLSTKIYDICLYIRVMGTHLTSATVVNFHEVHLEEKFVK